MLSISIDITLPIFFTLLGLLSVTSSQISQFHFINIRKNWTGAQKYCREMYTDLATVNNADEMKSLINSINDVSHDVYIGLYRSEEFKLHWSLTDTFDNKNQCKDRKDNKQDRNEGCDPKQKKRKWFIDIHDSKNQLVCINGNKTDIIFEDEKTWRKAQEYCKDCSENHRIENDTETKVWTGEFKEAWLWSDQSKSSFRFWRCSCPKCVKGQCKCPAVMLNGTCSVQSKPSYNFWNFLRPKCIKSQHRCAVVMVNGTGRWYETQCNVSLPFICQDNLILVRENLTWTEAVSYCKKHHMDLVSIHSEELQNRAAEKAAQASTSHVWMGLRYTCTFNFWFWIKNREAGCYQNWASGHGPHGLEECGLSGAMESTGGHHWVGRPENNKLNFICQLNDDTMKPQKYKTKIGTD